MIQITHHIVTDEKLDIITSDPIHPCRRIARLILVWICYTTMILLFGAEFTEAEATEKGSGITAEPGATRVIEQKKRVTDKETPKVEARPGKA